MELLPPQYATLNWCASCAAAAVHGRELGCADPIHGDLLLAEELWNTEVELDVVLDEQVMRLSDIIALQPGSRILLNSGLDAPVQLRCGSVALFEGKVGRRKN